MSETKCACGLPKDHRLHDQTIPPEEAHAYAPAPEGALPMGVSYGALAPVCIECGFASGRHHENCSKHAPEKAPAERITRAIAMAVKYGGIDGDHHKAWVIDQMVRLLAGQKYDELVREAKAGPDGPDTYSWDTGIAP